MGDRDDLWLESVYSDGTAAFVSSPCPKRGETVTIRLPRTGIEIPEKLIRQMVTVQDVERIIEGLIEHE